MHFGRLGYGAARSTGHPLALRLSALRLPRVLRKGARGKKGPCMIVGLFCPSARPRPAVGGGVAHPGPCCCRSRAGARAGPPACAAAHSGLRGPSAAAFAFLKPRAHATRQNPFFPFGGFAASVCRRVRAGGQGGPLARQRVGRCGGGPHGGQQAPPFALLGSPA